MHLNLPMFDQLAECKSILIAGMGGGFDVFCGLPIYFELLHRGYKVHLASLTDSSLKRLRGARRLTPSLVGIMPTTESSTSYFPERHLASWFGETREEHITIWCFEKLGVAPIAENYRRLIDHLAIDAIILVDGGVDSLMRGDEHETGSILEDIISLVAVNSIEDVKVKLSCCLGFGAELEVTHAHVLENIATLAKKDHLIGSCLLTKQMIGYQQYEAALLYAQAQPRQDTSVINSSVISAVRGHYGNYHLTAKTRDSDNKLWISPFMPMFWFFQLSGIVEINHFAEHIVQTRTLDEVVVIINNVRHTRSLRPDARIPL